MSFEIKPASRQSVKPLISLYSESGGGKTFSALLLARGFVGPNGKIAMVDSESGRGKLYADVLPGGYDVLDFEPPFTPARYIEAIEAIENAGYSIGILDSGSHEWELGVLDMASEIESKSGKGLNVWRKPKMEHAKFLLRLLRSRIPWIVCLRAKYKSRQIKNAKGFTEIVKDEALSPLQSEDFLFEMTLHGWLDDQHSLHITKHSHPSLKTCFPEGQPITSEHGRLLAQWCAAPGAPTSKPSSDGTKELKSKLWKLCQVAGAKTVEHAETDLRAHKILTPEQTLGSLNESELRDAITKLEIIIDEAKGNQ